jgi:hypothetical protein
MPCSVEAQWLPSGAVTSWPSRVDTTDDGTDKPERAQSCRRNQVTLPSVVGSAPHSSLM